MSEYGNWNEHDLRALLVAELEKMNNPDKHTREVLAMSAAQRTGASYRWLLDEVNRFCGAKS